jgi:hypothetical protein
MNQVLKAIQTVTRDEIDQRLVELESEQKALLALRRSVSARDRTRRRGQSGRRRAGITSLN